MRLFAAAAAVGHRCIREGGAMYSPIRRSYHSYPLQPADRIASTDITSHAVEQLRRSGVEVVHLIGRRGPVQVGWAGRGAPGGLPGRVLQGCAPRTLTCTPATSSRRGSSLSPTLPPPLNCPRLSHQHRRPSRPRSCGSCWGWRGWGSAWTPPPSSSAQR